MSPLEILRGARDLLAEPERWTKGHWARCGNERVDLSSPHADCFCLAAALIRFAGSWDAARDALVFLAGLLRPPGVGVHLVLAPIVNFSDNPRTTHADVLALLDKGIAQLEAK